MSHTVHVQPVPVWAMERPLTTVDVVIFTVRAEQLQVLLVRRRLGPGEPFPTHLALPGGFVDVRQDATLEDCARRKLLEKTGVRTPYLEQVGSWGSAGRDPRGWSATHVYFALLADTQAAQDHASQNQAVEASIHEQDADSGDAGTSAEGVHAEAVTWMPVDSLPTDLDLAFDHRTLLQAAVERLRSKVEYTSLPAHLLTQPFTLPQLQRAYEIVLGRPVDKSGFRTRMLAADFLEESGMMDVGAPRLAMGYRLRRPDELTYFPRTFSPRSGSGQDGVV